MGGPLPPHTPLRFEFPPGGSGGEATGGGGTAEPAVV